MDNERYQIKKMQSGTTKFAGIMTDLVCVSLPVNMYSYFGKSPLFVLCLILGVVSVADLVEYINVLVDKHYEEDELYIK